MGKAIPGGGLGDVVAAVCAVMAIAGMVAAIVKALSPDRKCGWCDAVISASQLTRGFCVECKGSLGPG